MKKSVLIIAALSTALGVASFTQAAHAQNQTRNVGPSPNNIAPPPPNFGTPPPPPGPVYGQTCPPGYITQITQDQWGRTVAVNCVLQQGVQPQNPIGGVIGGIIGGIISGGHASHFHCGKHRPDRAKICHTHKHQNGHH